MPYYFIEFFFNVLHVPGTGKSETGAHIAYILAVLNQRLFNSEEHHYCVFYCGPSNKSVDVVLGMSTYTQYKSDELEINKK